MRAAINVSVALNRRGMRHKSSIQSSGGWRQPTLFLPRAGILYGRCTCHHRPLNRLNGDRRSTIDRLFLFLRPSRWSDDRGTGRRGEGRRGEDRRRYMRPMQSAKDSPFSCARELLSSRVSWRAEYTFGFASHVTYVTLILTRGIIYVLSQVYAFVMILLYRSLHEIQFCKEKRK